MFEVLIDAFKMTEDLNIKVTSYDSILFRQKFNFNAFRKIEIVLAVF